MATTRKGRKKSQSQLRSESKLPVDENSRSNPSASEIPASDPNSKRMSFPEEMTIVFVRFYPEFNSDEEYQDLKSRATKKGKIYVNGFQWHLDDSDIHDISFAKYTDEVDELERILNGHIKGLVTSVYNNIIKTEGENAQVILEIVDLSGRELNSKMQKLASSYKAKRDDNNNNKTFKVKIVITSLPKTPEQLQEARDFFQSLKLTDQVYLSTHGNPNETGQGPFALYPEEIAFNYVNLGIQKDFMPFLAIWSCRSEVIGEDNKKSLAWNVYDELKKLGYQHPEIAGTRGLLYGAENASKYPSCVKKKKGGKRLPANEAITYCRTPQNSKMTYLIQTPDGIYTRNLKNALEREKRFSQASLTSVTKQLFPEKNNNRNKKGPSHIDMQMTTSDNNATTNQKETTVKLPRAITFKYTTPSNPNGKLDAQVSKENKSKEVISNYNTRSKSKAAGNNPSAKPTPTKKS